MQTISLPIFRYKHNRLESVNDPLAVEEPLAIRLLYRQGGAEYSKDISVTMRTPGEDAALAVGFLFTEGILTDCAHIESIASLSENEIQLTLRADIPLDLSKIERHFYTSSSCGVCGKTSIAAIYTLIKKTDSVPDFSVSKALILGLNEKVKEKQAVFQATGGLHASALFTAEGDCIALSEDVGRHNALDKLIGGQLLQNALPLSQNLLFLSGRASFELIQKAAAAQIPVVCALGAPSSLAVQLAQETGITLIGFLKSDSFNLYTMPERVR